MQAENVINILKREYPSTKYYLKFSSPLELMVAAILSAQTRDTIVNAVTLQLFRKYRTAKDYANADLEKLEAATKSIPFYKNKCRNIKETCRILLEKHRGEVPKNIEDLMKLPGIGRKTANAILVNAFGIVNGIVVDTHVIRLSQRLGWTKNKDPAKIEYDLMKIVPKKYWKTLPHLLKDHGREICTTVPKCRVCVLNSVCPKNGVTKMN